VNGGDPLQDLGLP